MGKIIGHEPVKLIVGLIGEEELFAAVRERLTKKFGRTDYISRIIDFDFTAYYEPEMGTGLKRQFISFAKTIRPEDLAGIKRYTNKLESRFISAKDRRRVNIDPGYLTLSKLVLATTKDHQHRIYLGKGMFAEVTLRFRGKTFAPWEWTYPDYRTEVYIDIFNRIRALFYREKKEARRA